MRVMVAGGGSVGTAIALDLVDRHHDVTLLEQTPSTADKLKAMLPGVNVMAADACEYASLAAADLRSTDVVIAATGDDEDNLVISWLSKQEFGVPRVISRINNARNEWLFMDLAQGRMRLIEVTLAGNAPAVANHLTLDELRLPDSVRVVAVVRSSQPLVPSATMHFLEHDHVILITRSDASQDCASAFVG